MPIEGLVRIPVDRAERFAIEAQGMVHFALRLPATVTIANLSRSGCLFRGGEAIELGTTISVCIPGVGACPAVVMRVAAEGYGCAFETPLAQAQIDRALAVRDANDGGAAAAVRRLRAAPVSLPIRAPSLWQRMRGALAA